MIAKFNLWSPYAIELVSIYLKPTASRPPRKPSRRWDGNVRMDLKEIGIKIIYFVFIFFRETIFFCKQRCLAEN